MTPEQIAAANNPAQGGQSGIFGASKAPTTPAEVAQSSASSNQNQLDFMRRLSDLRKNLKPIQPDRRLDGSDEGAPPVRVTAQGAQYSPKPDWAKEQQQSAPAPQVDTKVDTSKLYMGDDSWLKDATSPLNLPGSFVGDRTKAEPYNFQKSSQEIMNRTRALLNKLI